MACVKPRRLLCFGFSWHSEFILEQVSCQGLFNKPVQLNKVLICSIPPIELLIVLSWWDEPLLYFLFAYLIFWKCVSFKFTPWHYSPLFCLYASSALSLKWTEDDTSKKKKALLSTVFDNLSLWGSLIIHASLTGYLLSFCISLLKGMTKVEGCVAIINFPVTQQ